MKRLFTFLCVAVFCFCAVSDVRAQENGDGQDEQTAQAEADRKMEEDLYKKILDASLLQEKVLNYQVRKYGVDSVETIKPMEALAWMYMELGNYNEAEVLYRKVLQLRGEKVAPSEENTKYTGIAYFMLGEVNFLRDRYILAEDNYDRAMQLALDPEARGDALDRKGKIYKSIGNYEKALSFYLMAVEEYKSAKSSPKIDTRLMSAYASLVEVYKGLGLRLKAKEYQDLIDTMNKEESERK